MATFRFYQDIENISWERETYEVEANSYEDAVKLIEKEYESDMATLEDKGLATCISTEHIDSNEQAKITILNEDEEQIL